MGATQGSRSIFILVILVTLCVMLLINSYLSGLSEWTRPAMAFFGPLVWLKKPSNTTEEVKNVMNRTGVILLYSTFFGNNNWGLARMGRAPFLEGNCPYTNCVVTNNKSLAETADMLHFHCRDKASFPSKRHPHQIYVVNCWESPRHSNFAPFKNIVNATATYRLDSDIHTPYVKFKSRTTRLDGEYIPKYNSSKANAAVWPVSNCHAPSKRNVYVRELSKHYKVDTYGTCGPKKCSKSNMGKCMQMFEKQYKFFLSFENSICTGYVTEKLSMPMKYELVPIVYGGANYSAVAPRHSYIDTADFKTPKHLAEYLNYLSKNETAYNEYFAWKQEYDFLKEHWLCSACTLFNEKKSQRPAWDVQNWWSSPGVCKNGYVKKFVH